MAILAVKPKIDLAFKKIFSENQEILKSLISASLDISIEDIKILKVENTESVPEYIENKFCRLDIKVTIKGRIIDIEIQLNDAGNFRERALYYWSLLFSQALTSGKEYDYLPETIVISFIDFNLFGCAEYHSNFILKEVLRNEILTNKLSLHFFELKKLPQFIDKNKKIELWLKLIGAETEEEIHELETIDAKDINIAVNEIKRLNSSEFFRKQIEVREGILHDEATALKSAERKGEMLGKIETAREMLLDNETIEKIIKYTKLSADEIEKIKQNMN